LPWTDEGEPAITVIVWCWWFCCGDITDTMLFHLMLYFIVCPADADTWWRILWYSVNDDDDIDIDDEMRYWYSFVVDAYSLWRTLRRLMSAAWLLTYIISRYWCCIVLTMMIFWWNRILIVIIVSMKWRDNVRWWWLLVVLIDVLLLILWLMWNWCWPVSGRYCGVVCWRGCVLLCVYSVYCDVTANVLQCQ
jgi:hypothetical protein